MTPRVSNVALRVAARYQMGMDHSSPEEMKQYLHDHPHADPANHHVTKHEDHHKDEGPKQSWSDRLKGLSDKAKTFVKSAPENVKKFLQDDAFRRKTLMTAHETLTKAPEKLAKNLLDTAKHEVHEFKEAGHGIAAVIKGGKMSDDQKKAFKTVSFHVALGATAAALSATGILSGAAMFGKGLAKHVAMKSVSRALANVHVLEEVGHIGHGVGHLLTHLAAEDKKMPESSDDVMIKYVMACVAKEMQTLDADTMAEALEDMAKEAK